MSEVDAIFYDGRTSARHRARIRLTGTRLEIFDPDGTPVDAWYLNSLKLNDMPQRDGTVRLARRNGDGRILVRDPDFLAALYDRAPHLRRGRSGADTSWPLVAALVIAPVVTFLLLFWLFTSVAPSAVAALVPYGFEARIGKTVVRQNFGDQLCSDTAGQAALDELARRLMANIGDDSLPMVSIRVADIGVPNALATLGGQIVLFRGLIDGAASPEEVAGVLAHELGHVIERHPLKGYVRSQGLSLLLALMTGGSGDGGLELGAALATLSYTRDDERAADRWALTILQRANISTQGFADFFSDPKSRLNRARIRQLQRRIGEMEKAGEDSSHLQARLEGLQRRQADQDPTKDDVRTGENGDAGGLSWSLPDFLSTHPGNAERAAAARAAAGTGGPGLSDAEWQAVRRMCE